MSNDVESFDVVFVDDALIVLVDGSAIEAMIDVNLLEEVDDCMAVDRLDKFFTEKYGDWLQETSRDETSILTATLVRVLSYDEYDKVENVDVIGDLSVGSAGVTRDLQISCN